jgi:hypothetical protein
MDAELKIKRWVEYSLCEWMLDAYPKAKSRSLTFDSFCERIKESIIRGDISKKDGKVLGYITYRANREFMLSDVEIGKICADFFIDGNWVRYVRAIRLMKDVKYII